MQYILPTAQFEGMINQQYWSTLSSIGINETYILSVIINHIKLNGRINQIGQFTLDEPYGLEHEINHGRLDFILDDVKERFLMNRVKLVPHELVKLICVAAALMFQSLGYLLVSMINSLKLDQSFQLHGLQLNVVGKVCEGIAILVNYNPRLEQRSFHHG